MSDDFIRLYLEAKLYEWQQRSKAAILPPAAVATVLSKIGSDGDGPLWKVFVEDTVSAKRVAERLVNIRHYLDVGSLNDAAFELEWLERDIDAVKQMIANKVPLVNAVAAPGYERGARNAQDLNDAAARANWERHSVRAAEWTRWNEAAAKIWKDKPKLSATAVARILRQQLRIEDKIDTIAGRLKKPRKAQ